MPKSESLSYQQLLATITLATSLYFAPEAIQKKAFAALPAAKKAALATFELAITYLANLSGFAHVPLAVQIETLKRVGKHFDDGKPHLVAAELQLVKSAHERVTRVIKGYVYPTQAPDRGDYSSVEDYEEVADERKAYREELASLHHYRRFLESKEDLILYAVDLDLVGWPKKWLKELHNERLEIPVPSGVEREYLAAFRSKVERELNLIKNHPTEPLFNSTNPAEPVLMEDCIIQVKHRIAVENFAEGKGAFWGRLTTAVTGSDSDGSAARKALTERSSAPPYVLRVEPDDTLDDTIAKLILAVLTYDFVAPGWHKTEDK